MRLGTEAREALGNRSGKGLGVEAEEALGNRHFGSFGRRSGMPGNRDSLGAGSEAQAASGNRRSRGSTNFRRRRATGGARKSENEFQRTPGRPGFGWKRRETAAFRSAGKPELSRDPGNRRSRRKAGRLAQQGANGNCGMAGASLQIPKASGTAGC